MSDGIQLDPVSFRRMAAAVRRVEGMPQDFNALGAGDIRQAGTVLVRTPAELPAGYTGADPVRGVCIEDLPDGTVLETAACFIVENNGATLAADTIYQGRLSRMVTSGAETFALYRVQSGGGAGGAAIEFVQPWRFMEVHGRQGPLWTQDWSATYLVYVKSNRYFFRFNSIPNAYNIYAADVSKVKLPGDPYYLDEELFAGTDSDLSLYCNFDESCWPSYSLNLQYLTYQSPDWYEASFAVGFYLSAWSGGFGAPVLASKFTANSDTYVIGYGGEEIPVKTPYPVPGEESFWQTAGRKVIASPFQTRVTYRNLGNATGGFSQGIPYFRKNGQQNNLYFHFRDPFDLLKKTTQAEQTVLVSPIHRSEWGYLPIRVNREVSWEITQVYHDTPPNGSAPTGVLGGTLGAAGGAGAPSVPSTQPVIASAATNPATAYRRGRSRSGGVSTGNTGGFTNGTEGEE